MQKLSYSDQRLRVASMNLPKHAMNVEIDFRTVMRTMVMKITNLRRNVPCKLTSSWESMNGLAPMCSSSRSKNSSGILTSSRFNSIYSSQSVMVISVEQTPFLCSFNVSNKKTTNGSMMD